MRSAYRVFIHFPLGKGAWQGRLASLFVILRNEVTKNPQKRMHNVKRKMRSLSVIASLLAGVAIP